jgi:hypothetical protein
MFEVIISLWRSEQVNKNPEQEFWTRILNKNSEQVLILHISILLFTCTVVQIEIITYHSFDSIYFNSQFLVQIKFQSVYVVAKVYL